MKTIAPLSKKSDGWWIDTSELLCDVLEYGPYESRADAEEDRAGVIERIKARRAIGLTKADQDYAIKPVDLRDALFMLKKFTRGRFKFDKLTPEQVAAVGRKYWEFKGTAPHAVSLQVTADVLKVLLYREFGIDPTWLEADADFHQRATKFVSQA